MKFALFGILALFLMTTSCAQQKEYQLSTHILDVSKGIPAKNVSIKLEKMNNAAKTWVFISEKKTNENGRISDFLPIDKMNNIGIYKFTFYTKTYFSKQGIESFYPFIEVTFKIEGNNHFHVPITLSAFGFSTYKGS